MRTKEMNTGLRLIVGRIKDAENAQSSVDQMQDVPKAAKIAAVDSIANSNIAIAIALSMIAEALIDKENPPNERDTKILSLL